MYFSQLLCPPEPQLALGRRLHRTLTPKWLWCSYGNGYWGVTEANYLLVVINWVTAAVGPWLWASRVQDVLHLTPPSWLPQRVAQATVNETIIAFVSH
jgi:hypothetical protein